MDWFKATLSLLLIEPDVAGRHPGQLSGGQQQRVGLCRALMLEPRMLLLDEPFSALDPITRRGLHAQFLELRQVESVSTLLVTHDMEEARRLADFLVILRRGAIEQSGRVTEVLEQPGSDYVVGLLEGVA